MNQAQWEQEYWIQLQQDANRLQINLPENYMSYTDLIRQAHQQIWPDDIEEFIDPEAEPNIICNSLQIEDKFNSFKEYPYLFPQKKPLMLPPLRKPMEIMQHKINVIPESTWMPKWKDNNEMSEYYIT